jgi:hypothetical protein
MSQLLFGWLATSHSVRSIFLGLAIAAIVFGLVWQRATARYWNEPAHAV